MIAQSFTAIQDKLIRKLFEKFESNFPKEWEICRENDNYWGNIKKNFFGNPLRQGHKYGSKKPCTCFKKKSTDVPDTYLYLYIRIESRLWAELCQDGTRKQWIYLPTGNTDAPSSREDKESQIPNYFTMNDKALELYDDAKLERFIEKSIEIIKANLLM